MSLRRTPPNPTNQAEFNLYLLERMDDLTQKVYIVIGGLSILGLLQFLDPTWHSGVFSFP